MVGIKAQKERLINNNNDRELSKAAITTAQPSRQSHPAPTPAFDPGERPRSKARLTSVACDVAYATCNVAEPCTPFLRNPLVIVIINKTNA